MVTLIDNLPVVCLSLAASLVAPLVYQLLRLPVTEYLRERHSHQLEEKQGLSADIFVADPEFAASVKRLLGENREQTAQDGDSQSHPA